MTADGRGLRLGGRLLALGEIAAWRTTETAEPNVTGHLLAVGIFMGAGSLFVLPVLMALARPKFLLGGAVFIAIGLSALAEACRARTIRLIEVEVRLAGGEPVRFTTTERAQAEALAAVLAAATAGRLPA